MKQRMISKGQLEDSAGILAETAATTLSPSERAKGLYVPEKKRVPRPDFQLFAARCQEVPTAIVKNGAVQIVQNKSNELANFPGLRGFAVFEVTTKQGSTRKVGPAIVLADGRRLSVLTTEQPTQRISEVQQALLEQEYLKDQAAVSDKHRPSDVTNAGQLAPSLLIATTLQAGSTHADLHSLAVANKFAANFNESGRQDITFGHETYKPRSVVIPASNALFVIRSQDQVLAAEQLFGITLSASELATGLALAATVSRGGAPNLSANLQTMVRQ